MMDTYKEKYEAALERAKKLHGEDAPAESKDACEYIFPELRESEDERIRKHIVTFLLEADKMGDAPEEVAKWLAYLEKQKEQSFTHHEIDESLRDAVTHQMEDDGDVDDFVRKGIDDIVLKYAELGARWQKEQKPNIELIQRSWYMEGYTDGEFKREPMWNLVTGKGGPRYEKNEKYGQPLEQKEQMPVEKSLGSYMTDPNGYLKDWNNAYDSGFEAAKELIVTQPEKYGLQKPAEWSEEDERKVNDIIYILSQIPEQEKDEDMYPSALIDWLKSLRPQPKQEWSEEDRKRLESVIHRTEVICGGNAYGELKKDIDWLKSLPYRFSLSSWGEEIRDAFFGVERNWKPSKEQMEELGKAKDMYMKSSPGIASLYYDLKTKLM